MSLLSTIRGWRTLIVMGTVFVSGVLAAVNVIPTPIDAIDANQLADNAEAVAYAAENLGNAEALSAGVVAAVGLVGFVLRLVTKTPPGKKT